MLKEVKLNQDNPKWLSWRQQGIGSSEIAILMGSLPFKFNNILDLWKIKKGIMEDPFEGNEATETGKRLEPIARDYYNKKFKPKVTPKCFERTDLPFLRVSLDGIDSKKKKILELKCPGITNFKLAKNGTVLDYHYSQVQYQMAVTGVEILHYGVYNVDEGLVLFEIPRNEEYIEETIRRATIFWELIENNEPALPRHFGIDMSQNYSQPFQAGEHIVKFLGVFKD